MAHLLVCRVCKKNASSEALSCPHCGDPYITEEKKGKNEASQKYKYLLECLDRLVCPDTPGSCRVCRKSKKRERHGNSFDYYYVPDCNCHTDFDYSCKRICGMTYGELQKAMG